MKASFVDKVDNTEKKNLHVCYSLTYWLLCYFSRHKNENYINIPLQG